MSARPFEAGSQRVSAIVPDLNGDARDDFVLSGFTDSETRPYW